MLKSENVWWRQGYLQFLNISFLFVSIITVAYVGECHFSYNIKIFKGKGACLCGDTYISPHKHIYIYMMRELQSKWDKRLMIGKSGWRVYSYSL